MNVVFVSSHYRRLRWFVYFLCYFHLIRESEAARLRCVLNCFVFFLWHQQTTTTTKKSDRETCVTMYIYIELHSKAQHIIYTYTIAQTPTIAACQIQSKRGKRKELCAQTHRDQIDSFVVVSYFFFGMCINVCVCLWLLLNENQQLNKSATPTRNIHIEMNFLKTVFFSEMWIKNYTITTALSFDWRFVSTTTTTMSTAATCMRCRILQNLNVWITPVNSLITHFHFSY